VNARRIVEILARALGERLSHSDRSALEAELGALNRVQPNAPATTYGSTHIVRVSNTEISEGLMIRNPISGLVTVHLEQDGDARFGKNTNAPAATSLAIFAEGQRYNDEVISSGSVLMGNNSAGFANMLWNQASRRLEFRGGQTVKAYIDTNGRLQAVDAVLQGSITADSGSIGGWTISAAQIHKGGIVLDSASERIRSSNYQAGLRGFAIKTNGDAEFNNVSIRGELHAAVFVKNLIEARAGTTLWTYSAGSLALDMTLPKSGSWGMYINDPPGGGFLFANGDICRCRSEHSGGIADVWFSVDSRQSMGDGTQYYYCEYLSGSLNGEVIPAGASVLDYGSSSGGGMVSISADGAIGAGANLSIMTHAGAPYAAQTMQVRLGNMQNSYGAGANDRYGIGLGDYAGGNYLSYNAEGLGKFIVKAGTGVVTLDESGIVIASPLNLPALGASYKFVEGSSGYIFGLLQGYHTSTRNSMSLHVNNSSSPAAKEAYLSITSQASNVSRSELSLTAYSTYGGSTASINLVKAASGGATSIAMTADTTSVSGDFYSVAWNDWSATTISGWSSTTVRQIRFKKIGRLVFFEFYIEGTSNSNACNFTLPYAPASYPSYGAFAIRARDNGVWQPCGMGYLTNGNTTAQYYTTMGGGLWTTSGTKTIMGQFFYEAAS
jgi:hypothetical protein